MSFSSKFTIYNNNIVRLLEEERNAPASKHAACCPRFSLILLPAVRYWLVSQIRNAVILRLYTCCCLLCPGYYSLLSISPDWTHIDELRVNSVSHYALLGSFHVRTSSRYQLSARFATVGPFSPTRYFSLFHSCWFHQSTFVTSIVIVVVVACHYNQAQFIIISYISMYFWPLPPPLPI